MVTQQEAREALGDVHDASTAMRRALADGGASLVLIIWGAIWLVGFLLDYLLPVSTGWRWLALGIIGAVATFAIFRRYPVRNTVARRVSAFWFMLGAYGFLWLMVIAKASPRPVTVTGPQFGAYIVTLTMFAYVVMGLWLRSALLFWLGLAVTGIAAAALFLIEPHFSLVMAFAGGGALIASGLGMRRWRR